MGLYTINSNPVLTDFQWKQRYYFGLARWIIAPSGKQHAPAAARTRIFFGRFCINAKGKSWF